MSSKRRIAVISNPISGRGTNRRKRTELIALLNQQVEIANGLGQAIEYKLFETTTAGRSVATGELVAGSASALARFAALDGFDVVAAAGGDGTVGEVANGLIGTNAALAVIPLGTGNDFSRAVGIGTDLERAVTVAVRGSVGPIDLGRGPHGFFINIAGCGFDAIVAREVNTGFKMLRGTVAYLAAVIKTLITFKPVPMEIVIDGERHELKAMLCAIANARCYGGGMMVAPNASWTDGLLDVVVVGDVSVFEFLKTFPKVFKGTHLSHPKVHSWRGREITVHTSVPIPVLADGEDLGETPICFEVQKDAVLFVNP